LGRAWRGQRTGNIRFGGDLSPSPAFEERQRGTVGDLPEQDWSLRVTWVFRRLGESDWELVHRHADTLVHPIDHERLGQLARGD